MESVKLPVHEHPLLPITRFSDNSCNWCTISSFFHRGFTYGGFIYGGYRCNESGCQAVFHRDCAESLPEIKHPSHPDHPLKLLPGKLYSTCSRCGKRFINGYICSICDFKLDLQCAKRPASILENLNLHQHPLKLFSSMDDNDCQMCDYPVLENDLCYGCHLCEFVVHEKCAEFFPLANHTSHPQHPLKLLTTDNAPDYADKKCLLCGFEFCGNIYHCDVCNFSICKECMKIPPPVVVESPTTHEHELHLVPRRIDFTCNACGTLGDRSPYFCLQCNFMIHRECIDLPRVININRHDHRISYTRRLGHGDWKCKVCRKKVDGFYGAYTCVKKCPSFVVHSLCATRKNLWDMIELEGTPDEEEEVAPFEVIDDNTIKHFSHDHNLLQINNNDDHGRIQPANIVCEACHLQIFSEPFYSCKQCIFALHQKCANHPRRKRHVLSNLPFILLTNSRHKVEECRFCHQNFTGFRYRADDANPYMDVIIDVRCAAVSDTLEHGSHLQHPLYYYNYAADLKECSRCGSQENCYYRCDECDYTLCRQCALFSKKVMKIRYDDHPLFLSFGEKNVDGHYWCEACERKVNPKEWFYTCNDCGTILHISCVVGDFSNIMPGSLIPYSNEEVVVSNTSICRPLCSGCNFRCTLPSIIKISSADVDEYFCSTVCSRFIKN